MWKACTGLRSITIEKDEKGKVKEKKNDPIFEA